MNMNGGNKFLIFRTFQGHFAGLFPRDNPKNTRFSINFFTSIGLGGLTDELREHLKNIPKNNDLRIGSAKESSSDSSSSSVGSSSSNDSSNGKSLLCKGLIQRTLITRDFTYT